MPRYGYSHYRNGVEAGHAAFITTTCLDFVHAFVHPEIADIMTGGLLADCRFYESGLSAFVAMPHHIHLVVLLPKALDVRAFVNRIKANSARRILPRLHPNERAGFGDQNGLNGRTFWQRSFRSFPIANSDDFWQKVRYVRSIPVRAGLADREHDYRWSSALFWEEGLGSDELGLRIDDAMIERFAPLDSLVLRRASVREETLNPARVEGCKTDFMPRGIALRSSLRRSPAHRPCPRRLG